MDTVDLTLHGEEFTGGSNDRCASILASRTSAATARVAQVEAL
ncbi:hypothetical protein [Streptomyces sp. NPDC058466]